jgi:M6 family metalloprotease-like protein
MSWWKYLLISSFVGAASTWAIQATPFLINSTQPDGSVVQIRKVGNEHFNYTLTGEDSVLIVRDSSGYWNYADEHGKKTGIRVHAKSKRGQKEKNFLKNHDSRQILEKFHQNHRKKREKELENQPLMLQSSADAPQMANEWGGWGGGTTTQITNTDWPTRPALNSVKKEGDVRGLVILVQFSDVKFKRDNANEEYTDYLNKEGYSNYYMSGSVRDFFIENSMGKYRPTFDVAGPITLKKTRNEYGSLVSQTNIAAGAVNAISEAMDSLVARNMDFSPYDSDGDGTVDFVYMIYAGVGSADTDVQAAIWPHSYNVRKRLTRNMYMNRYACSPEIDGQSYMINRNTTALNGIGTFCHEFSHVLGLQDHYDVNVNDTRVKTRYTPGQWDLMDAGSYNCPQNRSYTTSCSPANLSAFERFSLGWLEPRRLEISDTTFVLNTILENDGLVLTTKNDNEYYFVDFRLQKGFDIGLPNKGMLIWHINYDRYAWMNNAVNVSDPMRVDLVEADGEAKGTPNSIANDAFPTNRGVNSFNGFVTWSGDSLGLEIYDITIVDSVVTFKTRGKRVSPDAGKSSSSVASSSSKAVSSSSVPKSSSSSSIVVSSSSVQSSSSAPLSSSIAVVPSSSSVALSSTSVFFEKSSSSAASVVELSSSSETMSVKTSVAAPVRFAVNNGMLTVNANFDGNKTVHLFDVNGTLLLKKTFDGHSCEIRLKNIRGKSFVVGTLESGGRLLKSFKLRLD